jgi:hypothetical protein
VYNFLYFFSSYYTQSLIMDVDHSPLHEDEYTVDDGDMQLDDDEIQTRKIYI